MVKILGQFVGLKALYLANSILNFAGKWDVLK